MTSFLNLKAVSLPIFAVCIVINEFINIANNTTKKKIPSHFKKHFAGFFVVWEKNVYKKKQRKKKGAGM